MKDDLGRYQNERWGAMPAAELGGQEYANQEQL